MKLQISRWLAAALMTGPALAHGAINFSTDTATTVAGTFSITGTTVESATPATFDFGLPFCMPVRASRDTTAAVGLQCAGAPDDPRVSFQNSTPQTHGPVDGAVSSLAGSSVATFYFRFSDLQDTGGSNGTFSGAFCFSRSPTGCGSADPIPATLGGFQAPVVPPSVATNVAKAGQTIPLKFHAATAEGPITDLVRARLEITGVACAAIPIEADPVDEYSTGDEGTLENLGAGNYQYNWKTRRGATGTCKLVTLSLPKPYTTPTHPIATFQFTR
jgi:hypothetical protein